MTAALRLHRSGGLVCVITDRRRLLPAANFERQRSALLDQAAAAALGGADLLQIRERDLGDRQLLELTREIVGAISGSSLRVLVNDRVDIAIAAGADGVQLRGDSIGVTDARALLGDERLIGKSVHTVDEARAAAAQQADFVLYGTVFPTASKPAGHAAAGTAGLADVGRACDAPVLAVGGIDADKVRAVAAAGAAGVAAIGWFATCDAGEMQSRIAACRQAFDSARTRI